MKTEDNFFVITLTGFGLIKTWEGHNKEELDNIVREIKELEPYLINLLNDYNLFKDKI